MKRLENAAVAPATLFMGVTVLAVVGATIYYATRKDEDEVEGGGNGGNGGGVVAAPGVIPSEDWNTSPSGTHGVPVAPNRMYTTGTTVPEDFAHVEFDVRPSGGVVVLDVRGPEISQTPGEGARIGLTFKTTGPGAIELVWPKGAVVGHDILVLYRRLNVTIGAVA